MANTTGASLNPIYTRLNSAPEYHPLEADTFADWSVEAGDLVTVTRDGKSYKSPVHQASMNWKRGQQVAISSTGKKERDAISRKSQQKFARGGSGLRNDGYLHWYVEDQYGQLRSGLELTASSAYLYSKNLYSQMESGLKLTASSAHLYSVNKYKEMASGLKLTASSAILYSSNKYKEMSTGLKLTASSAILYASNKYKELSAGLKLTASSAMLYAESRTNRAYIMARINAKGEGEALINADRVRITGNTTIAGMLQVSSGSLNVNGNIQAGLTGGKYIRCQSLKLVGASSSQGVSESTLTDGTLRKMIAKAEKDGNTLKLWTFDNIGSSTPSITFKKATTLSGAWSSGVFTASADSGETLKTSITGGAGSWSGKTVTIPIYATIGTSASVYNTGKTVQATYSGGGDVAGIDLGNIAVSTTQPTGYEGATLLTQLANSIKNNRNTYVWFQVKALDGNGNALYTKNYYCASA